MTPDVLYRDEHMTVVHKPAGVVVHPTYKNPSGTLLDALRATGGYAGPDERPSIVGRLDRLTSGVVIAARTAIAHAALQRTLASEDSEKLYVAIVDGVVDAERGEIDLPLKVDPADRRRTIVAPDGARSLTRFERRLVGNGLTVLHCRPLTGRRHQIRVHLAARGWPVVGDAVYGRARLDFPRHALHAWRVSFTDPFTGAQQMWEAPVPPAFDEMIGAPAS
jgi:23S rRNA pseudouridine1911/1915/1917 synthase